MQPRLDAGDLLTESAVPPRQDPQRRLDRDGRVRGVSGGAEPGASVDQSGRGQAAELVADRGRGAVTSRACSWFIVAVRGL